MARKRKTKPRQLEVQWSEPESFKLTIQQTTDGDKIMAEAEQLEADRHVSEMLQRQMTV